MGARDNEVDEGGALALEGLLRWYAAMGADAAIDETPHDRFVEPKSAPLPAAKNAAVSTEPVRANSSASAVSRSAEALVTAAQGLADSAADLDELGALWASVPGCTLAASSRMIPAAIPVGAALMIVGGAPAEDDERAGAIFAGAGGRLLDAMLGTIGLVRADVALVNVVPWRPPGNRAPTPLELALCLPFCRRAIALASPGLLLCLGERAVQPLLGTRDALMRLRGRWLAFEGEATIVKTLATYAPSYLLTQPLQKRLAWSDLLMLEAELDALRHERS